MTTYPHKRGGTLQLYFVVVDLQQGEDVTGSVGRAQVRTKCGQLVEELTFTWINDGIDFTLVSPTNTSSWLTGTLCFDVRFYMGAQSVASDTGFIEVTEGITQ